MQQAPCISLVASLLADPKRSAMIWALIDGSSRAAEELALLTGVTQSSATAHLARLSAGGLLKREARGRKRFFRLATPQVGAAVEALASVSAKSPISAQDGASGLPGLQADAALRRVRLCGDHLGGRLAADLLQRLLESQWLKYRGNELIITFTGAEQMGHSGVYVHSLASRGTAQACTCMDWSDERPHLGGPLGASLLRLFTQSGWLLCSEDNRLPQVTAAGELAFARFGQPQAGVSAQ